MFRKSSAYALVLASLAGCSFLQSDSKQKADQVVATAFTGRPGQLIVPRYCKLDTAIISRPIGDPAVAEAAWRVADEQGVPPEQRQALASNGLRIGVITGNLPAEVADAFQNKPPQKPTEWVHFSLPEGAQTPISVHPRVEPETEGTSEPEVVTLLVNHRGKIDGKEYASACGLLNVTAEQKGAREVTLRLVPAIQHGPKRGGFAPVQNSAPFAQQEFTYKNGQQEEAFRDLAVSLDIQPGQYVVVGCRMKQERSLGSFLFTRLEGNTDRMQESLLLIQADRNNVGSEPKKGDHVDGPPDMPGMGIRPVAEIPKFESKTPKDKDAPAR